MHFGDKFDYRSTMRWYLRIDEYGGSFHFVTIKNQPWAGDMLLQLRALEAFAKD